jgi:oligoendopeptidase F
LRKRRQLAHNAGFSDYRAYRWQEMGRLDYAPTDCLALHDAIEIEIIPLSTALHEHRRRSLSLTSIQPWAQELTPELDISLRPFADARDFEEKMTQVYRQLDPEFGVLKAQNNYASAWHAYREALALGNTRSLPELYRAAGAELPFTREVMKKVAAFLKQEAFL